MRTPPHVLDAHARAEQTPAEKTPATQTRAAQPRAAPPCGSGALEAAVVHGHSTVPTHPAARRCRGAGAVPGGLRSHSSPKRPAVGRIRPLAWAMLLVAVLLSAGPPTIGYAAPPPQGALADHVPRVDYGFPVRPGAVLRRFDGPAQPWLPGHRGVDLAAVPGQSVLAAAAGRVAFAGMVAGRPVVSVDHQDGVRTTYEPVAPAVSEGQEVGIGTVLGRVSGLHSGCSAAACLHWGARVGGDADAYIDPLGLLGARYRPVVLKPLQG